MLSKHVTRPCRLSCLTYNKINNSEPGYQWTPLHVTTRLRCRPVRILHTPHLRSKSSAGHGRRSTLDCCSGGQSSAVLQEKKVISSNSTPPPRDIIVLVNRIDLVHEFPTIRAYLGKKFKNVVRFLPIIASPHSQASSHSRNAKSRLSLPKTYDSTGVSVRKNNGDLVDILLSPSNQGVVRSALQRSSLARCRLGRRSEKYASVMARAPIVLGKDEQSLPCSVSKYHATADHYPMTATSSLLPLLSLPL
jgi:hypothetical protein